MDEHNNLVNQGTYLMLDRLLKDLQAEDEAMQTRALQALQSLAKGKRGGSNLPMQSIQTAFQQGKGLPRLITLLDRVVTPRNSRSGQGKAIMAGAVDALAAMTRNNAAARKEAIEAGAVPALCSVLGTGDDEPVSIEVLKALYTIIAPDGSGHTTTELFASGGVHALVRLLDNVLEYARELQRSVWVREVLALLYPLVRRSRMVARVLASEMVGVCNVLQTVGDPLSLSLALDIMEEVLHAGDARKYGRRMARDGALAALVHAAHEKGMGSKAMLLLATLATEAELLHVLRSLLQPRDYACLIAIARKAADAEDLDSKACLGLLSQLLSGPGVAGLRALTLGRCLNSALSLSPIASDLFLRATSDAGLLLLQNLPREAMGEAAIAAALLLEHVPQAVSILLRPGALNSLVDAALEEVASPSSDGVIGSEACHALSSAVRWLPQDISLSRQSTATEEHLCPPSMLTNGIGKHTQDAAESKSSQSAAGDDSEHMERSHTGQLDSIAEQEALHNKGNATSQEHALENGHSSSAQDGEQYETLTFHVGGKEFYALAWVMAGASRAIAQTIQQIPDTSTAAVVIPDVPGLPPSRMYEVFALAAECALDRSRPVPTEEALDLWALAASLQMPEIQRRCERVIASSALQSNGNVERALSLTRGHKDSGDLLRGACAKYTLNHWEHLRQKGDHGHLASRVEQHHSDRTPGASLRETCAKYILDHLEELRQDGHLASLVKQHRSELRRGMVAYLRRQSQAAKPDPLKSPGVPSSACGDSPRSTRSIASSRAGALGLSRFSPLADTMDRQSSVPAASVASLDSPSPSRAASCGQFEVATRGNGVD